MAESKTIHLICVGKSAVTLWQIGGLKMSLQAPVKFLRPLSFPMFRVHFKWLSVHSPNKSESLLSRSGIGGLKVGARKLTHSGPVGSLSCQSPGSVGTPANTGCPLGQLKLVPGTLQSPLIVSSWEQASDVTWPCCVELGHSRSFLLFLFSQP